jgi:hypothetical protein
MTKGEMIVAMDGLPDDTEIVWHDQTDSARWTFLDVDVAVENLVRVKTKLRGSGEEVTYWERPTDVRQYESGPVPVIVLS